VSLNHKFLGHLFVYVGFFTYLCFMKDRIIEWIKIVLFFVVLLIGLSILISLGEEKPHKVIINGKEYTKIKEWNGDHWQIIMLPSDKDTLK
jgi:uncharacterized linocin/CFP29 family protein